MAKTERILGVAFFAGDAAEAVAGVEASGGCVLIPASPALTKLRYDSAYRAALESADYVLPDSGLLVSLWRALGGKSLAKISRIAYLRELLGSQSFRSANVVWIVGSTAEKKRALAFFSGSAMSMRDEHFFVREQGSAGIHDHELLLAIEHRKPEHIVVALRSGRAEELAVYLRDYVLSRPRIHCVGAGLGFLTGSERAIPEVLERRQLGWVARFIAQPRLIIPRLAIASTVAAMIIRYRSEMPPLQSRWSDL